MIDITFDCNEIEIENRVYNHLGDRGILKEALVDLLTRACYSGETISLWEAKGNEKHFVQQFYSANKTNRRYDNE